MWLKYNITSWVEPWSPEKSNLHLINMQVHVSTHSILFEAQSDRTIAQISMFYWCIAETSKFKNNKKWKNFRLCIILKSILSMRFPIVKTILIEQLTHGKSYVWYLLSLKYSEFQKRLCIRTRIRLTLSRAYFLCWNEKIHKPTAEYISKRYFHIRGNL